MVTCGSRCTLIKPGNMFIDTLEHLVVDEAAGCAAAPGRPDDGGLSRDFF